MYLEGERETWEGEGATGAAWKCLAKWRGTGPAPTTTPFGHRAACLARVGRGGFSAATAAQALGSSHSDRPPPPRPASCRQGLELEPSLLRDSILRSDPTKAAEGVLRCLWAHTPPIRGAAPNQRGGSWGLDSRPGSPLHASKCLAHLAHRLLLGGWVASRPLCPLCGCPRDKSAPYSLGHSGARGATERAHRKRCSPPHANNNLML